MVVAHSQVGWVGQRPRPRLASQQQQGCCTGSGDPGRVVCPTVSAHLQFQKPAMFCVQKVQKGPTRVDTLTASVEFQLCETLARSSAPACLRPLAERPRRVLDGAAGLCGGGGPTPAVPRHRRPPAVSTRWWQGVGTGEGAEDGSGREREGWRCGASSHTLGLCSCTTTLTAALLSSAPPALSLPHPSCRPQPLAQRATPPGGSRRRALGGGAGAGPPARPAAPAAAPHRRWEGWTRVGLGGWVAASGAGLLGLACRLGNPLEAGCAAKLGQLPEPHVHVQLTCMPPPRSLCRQRGAAAPGAGRVRRSAGGKEHAGGCRWGVTGGGVGWDVCQGWRRNALKQVQHVWRAGWEAGFRTVSKPLCSCYYVVLLLEAHAGISAHVVHT